MKVLCENKFSRKDIWKVEAEVMKVMDWKLSPLTPFTFARDLTFALRIDDDQNLLDSVMEFLQDVTEDYESVGYRSSTLAITAVYIHIKILQIEVEDLFAKVVSSLEFLRASEMVDAYHYLVRLYHSKNSSEVSSVAEVKEVNGFSIARSPCSVDADLGEHLFSLAWATDFCGLFEEKRTADDDDSDKDSYLLLDNQRKPKRVRTAEFYQRKLI
ncbi:G2/mitotic-specific cyclin a, partial [Globisporangium splendens]